MPKPSPTPVAVAVLDVAASLAASLTDSAADRTASEAASAAPARARSSRAAGSTLLMRRSLTAGNVSRRADVVARSDVAKAHQLRQ